MTAVNFKPLASVVLVLFCGLTSLAAPPSDLRTADFALILPSQAPSRQAQQQTLRGELSKRAIHVTGAASTLVNAVFVRVPESRIAELQGLPGVGLVVYLPPLKRHLNRALDLVQASGAWSQVGGVGNAGAGVKIAVIDSGIDQTHPALQDSSMQAPAGYPIGDPNFTNSKVIVARSYVSQLPSAVVDPQHSLPDDITPSDHFGHGTAIAMIAAGAPVKAPVASINGVAPKAYLGNYKIYGTPGINDQPTAAVVIQALEDALKDGMDIAILASGSAALFAPFDQVAQCQPQVSRPYIPAGACDILAYAVENAIQSGLTVVVSAGEDGASGYNFPTLATINSPGTAPDAITVGATTNSHVLYSTVSMSGSGVPANLTGIDGLFGRAPKPGGPYTAPLVDVTTLGNDGLACDPLPANSLNGSIALIQRGTCSFDFKSNNAKTAGAVGVLLYLATGDDALFFPIGLEDTAIPLVLVGNTAGSAIKSYLATHKGASVTLDPSWHETSSTADTVADYSSRGPSIGLYSTTPARAIKPELVAPGGYIYTAAQRLDPNGDLYDASGYTTVEGNSFSAALVAGAVALVKQAHPGYTPAQLKSAVVNTATTSNLLDESGPARVNAAGAGKLNVQAAVGAQVAVAPSTLAFGVISATLPTATLAITNSGSSAATLFIAIEERDMDSRARVTAPSSVTIPPGQVSNVTVSLTGTRPNPGSYEGQINITWTAPAGLSPTSGGSLHVPYQYLVGDGALSTANIFPVAGDQYVSVPGLTGHLIGTRITDQYGVPIVGRPVTWSVSAGGGQIDRGGNGIPNADVQTDIYGTVNAVVDFGTQAGDQIFTADLNGISWEFDLFAAAGPVITTNGVVNGASFQATKVAPGSYISINGQNLAHVTASYVTTNLPLAIAATSVSFDVPSAGISVPGHVSYISPTQINVQVPWELAGQPAAQMKVITANIASVLYNLPLADYGPAAFEYTAADGQLYAAALDTNGQLITSTNPAQRGQYISVYANGLGPVTHQPASGATSPADPLASSATPSAISVTIGGKPAQVAFSGLAPNYVALYQLNVVVPTDAASGVQPMVITGNGVTGKTSQLAVSP